jgi:hypothetical protein
LFSLEYLFVFTSKPVPGRELKLSNQSLSKYTKTICTIKLEDAKRVNNVRKICLLLKTNGKLD